MLQFLQGKNKGETSTGIGSINDDGLEAADSCCFSFRNWKKKLTMFRKICELHAVNSKHSDFSVKNQQLISNAVIHSEFCGKLYTGMIRTSFKFRILKTWNSFFKVPNASTPWISWNLNKAVENKIAVANATFNPAETFSRKNASYLLLICASHPRTPTINWRIDF